MALNTRKEWEAYLQGVKTALATTSASFGVETKVGALVYDPTKGTASISLKISTKGFAEDNKTNFERLATRYGLQPTDYGKEINIMGKRLTISGINPKSKKYPIQAQMNGTTYKIATKMAVDALSIPKSFKDSLLKSRLRTRLPNIDKINVSFNNTPSETPDANEEIACLAN